MRDGTRAQSGKLSISVEEFGLLRTLVHKRFGIFLADGKRDLVVNRLQGLLREGGYDSFRAYYDAVLRNPTGNALGELVDRISTNHTFFYREKAHFEYFLGTALPEIEKRPETLRSRDLRIWCAAASSGEEPYTLAMLLHEHFGQQLSKWKAGVLATDISDHALGIARSGVYPAKAVEKLPPALVKRYFKKQPEGDFSVIDGIRRDVVYRRFNLMNEHFPFQRPFDAIFCRNVMIYFDEPTRRALVERLYHAMQPGGYLFVGHSEALDRRTCPFEFVQSAVYRKEA